MRFLTVLLALTLTTACNTVYGEIDGEEVPTDNAFYVEAEDYFGSDGLLIVFLSHEDMDCETMADFLEEMDEADDDNERVYTWEYYNPEEFWEVQIRLRVDDPDDELAGQELDGSDWNSVLSDDDEVSVAATHYTDYPTENSFNWWGWVTGEVTDYYESYTSDGGDGKIQAYDPGEHIRGVVTTEMVDREGDSEGEVTYNFSANRCREIESDIF